MTDDDKALAALTPRQKMEALSLRFYQGLVWKPKAGDYYTTSRADLELYQVVAIEDGKVKTRYTTGSTVIAEWPEDEFTSVGFGPKRVYVPDFVLSNPSLIIQPPAPATTRSDSGALVLTLRSVANGHTWLLKDARGDYGLCDTAADALTSLSADLAAAREAFNDAMAMIGSIGEERTALRAEVEALRGALAEIAERHIPDQPAASGGDELEWAVRQHTALRAIARAALSSEGGKG